MEDHEYRDHHSTDEDYGNDVAEELPLEPNKKRQGVNYRQRVERNSSVTVLINFAHLRFSRGKVNVWFGVDWICHISVVGRFLLSFECCAISLSTFEARHAPFHHEGNLLSLPHFKKHSAPYCLQSISHKRATGKNKHESTLSWNILRLFGTSVEYKKAVAFCKKKN